MAHVGEGLFKRYLPKIHEKLRKVLEFKPNDPNRSWQVPPANAKISGLEGSKLYRYPAPNSLPQASIPGFDDPDLIYDTTYYKKDTMRAPKQIHSYVAPSLRGILDKRAKAREQLAPQVGPDDKPSAPSQGNKNPAVMKYDPTGLRTTMTASNKAWKESLQEYMPIHNVKPWWWHSGVNLAADAQAKGLPPPPGRCIQWEVPEGAKVASW